MDFTRQPLINQDKEDVLKSKMAPLWSQTPLLTGMEIAKILKFGQPNTEFSVLKPNCVYFYRGKFNLPIRQKPRFKITGEDGLPKHRYKTSPKELKLMTPKTFITKLNEMLPRNEFNEAQRCYLILHFFTPLRESEIFERVQNMPLANGEVRNDFEITETKLIIHLLRKKKKFHKDADEPISIPLSFPLVDEVAEYLESKSWETTFNGKPNRVKRVDVYGFQVKSRGVYAFDLNHRPFPISKTTADNWVKSVFKGFYCHYFRFNFVTSMTKIPDMKISELRAKTHLTLSALERYIFTPEKAEDELDAKRLQEMKKQGVIE